MSILPNDSVMSFNEVSRNQTNHESGSAVIITSQSVKSYTIGTPSPKHGIESNRSSRDWKAWLSHEVSELDVNTSNDYTFSNAYTPTLNQYSPSTRHIQDSLQAGEDETATVTIRESTETVIPYQQSGSEEPRINQTVTENDTPSPVVADGNDAHSYIAATNIQPCTLRVQEEPVADPVLPQKTPSPPGLVQGVGPRTQRLSSLTSAFGHGSSTTSTSTSSTPKSARMNDRFPFIVSNRSSSSHTGRLRRTSRTLTGHSSGSSSLGSRATPSPKVYSDFSAPGTGRTSQHEPNTRSKRSNEVANEDLEKDTAPQNANPRPQTQIRRPEQSRIKTTRSLPLAMTRPKSMLPLSSAALNRSPSSLSQYVTTADKGVTPAKSGQAGSPERSPQRHRLKMGLQAISPTKLTARPKSTFDLSSTNTPPGVINCVSTNSPDKKENSFQQPTLETVTQRKLAASRISTGTTDFDTNALCLLADSPWAISSAPPSSRTSFEIGEATRPKVRVMHSSSTLALNKEPSPGLEDRIIDSILGCEEKAASVRSDVEGGRSTPGQRMAEKFLKERGSPRGSGAGTPVKEGVSASGSVGFVREDTPAFL
jgi:hypothetical protein